MKVVKRLTGGSVGRLRGQSNSSQRRPTAASSAPVDTASRLRDGSVSTPRPSGAAAIAEDVADSSDLAPEAIADLGDAHPRSDSAPIDTSPLPAEHGSALSLDHAEVELAALMAECERARAEIFDERESTISLEAHAREEENIAAAAQERCTEEHDAEILMENNLARIAQELSLPEQTHSDMEQLHCEHEDLSAEVTHFQSQLKSLAGAAAKSQSAARREKKDLQKQLNGLETQHEIARNHECSEWQFFEEILQSCNSKCCQYENCQQAINDNKEGEAELMASILEIEKKDQQRQDAYWDEAHFLTASVGEVHELRMEVVERKAIVDELEQALESIDSACVPASQIELPVSECTDSPQTSVMAATPEKAALRRTSRAGVTPEHHSRAPFAEHQSQTLGVVASLPLPPSPVIAARAALQIENERLHERVAELRRISAELMGSAGDVAAVDMGETSTSEDTVFIRAVDAAVAGTGARVVDWMKQALQEDVLVLRDLDAERRKLDEDCRRERQMQGALTRRLMVTEEDASARLSFAR